MYHLSPLVSCLENHSTIKHGVEKIEHDVEENEQLANTIDIIKKKINPV